LAARIATGCPWLFCFSAKSDENREGRRPMGHKCGEDACQSHAMQRSLYRHALNALQMASRSSCASSEARELAERCAEMLRAAEAEEQQPVIAG
jgi:hypothetical protein